MEVTVMIVMNLINTNYIMNLTNTKNELCEQ